MIDIIETKSYGINNLLHRLDGPAVEQSDGTKFWLQFGQLHKEDGPAALDRDKSIKE